jgi:hypothetical protein
MARFFLIRSEDILEVGAKPNHIYVSVNEEASKMKARIKITTT